VRRLGALICALALAGVAASSGFSAPARSACTTAHLSWGTKCLAAGEYCKIRGDAEYHRFGYHCHTGRLSRSASGGNAPGSGCQPGYSPCLPRVADLNCADIPASMKPIRVSGSDPYRLDGDGDGLACRP
jgi:hypothetical protein